MNTRITAIAAALAVTVGIALAQQTGSSTSNPSSSTDSSMSSSGTGATGTSGATTGQSGMTGTGSSTTGGSTSGMVSSASSGTGSTQPTFTDEKTFVQGKMQAHKQLMDIYKMAEDKAQNESVKDFAKQARQSHEKMGDKLKEIAKDMNIDTSAAEKSEQASSSSTDASSQASASGGQHGTAQHLSSLKTRLQGLSGKEFDREFLTEVINMHQRDVTLFRLAQRGVTKSELKEFVTENLPKLQQQMEAAQSSFEKATGTAWKGSSSSYTPTATYDTQSGMSGTSPSSSPGSTTGAPSSGTSPSSPSSSGTSAPSGSTTTP